MPQWPLEGLLVRPRTVDDAATFRFTHSRTAKSVADVQWVTQQFGGTWPSFNANATKALVSEPAQHLNEKRRRHISSSSNTLAMQLRSLQTRDEIALHQEWDDGAASTVVASEVMHSPSARRNINAFGHPEGQPHAFTLGFQKLVWDRVSVPRGPSMDPDVQEQTVACFFCRSRKIACTPRPVDETNDKPCGRILRCAINRVPHGSTRTRRQPVPGPANTVPDRPAGFKPVRVTRGYVRTRGTLRVGGSIANHRNNGKNVIRALFRGDYITTLAQMKYGPDVSGFGATRHGVLSVSNHRKNVGRVSE
ncbi:hypothetical protein B0H13DRAFT_1865172 [Mycena leptocephala]|nr:hypothetical protein B0H13DRAFT_1865172 [Mycena leptocephala]